MSPLTFIAVVGAVLSATCHASAQQPSPNQDNRQPLRVALGNDLGHSEKCCAEKQEERMPINRLKRSPPAGGGGGVKTSKQQPNRRGCHIGVRASPSLPFMASIQLGTPPQTFEALIDTSSPISWMLHSKCQVNDAPWDLLVANGPQESDRQAAQRARFAHDQSSSYRRDRAQGRVELKYAQDIDLRGVWVNETVRLADCLVGARSLAVRQQPLAMITHVRGPEANKFDYEKFPSAVIGLGFPAQALSGNQSTLFESLLLAEQVREPVFSFYFKANQASGGGDEQQKRGELILGEIDKSLYTGEITWTEVTETPAWQVRVRSIRTGEPVTTAVCAHGCEAILSTGTSVIVGPSDEVAQLNERLGFARTRADRRVFAAPGLCADHPGRNMTLVFEIENARFEVSADKLMMDQVTCKGQERCVSVLRALDLERAGLPGQKWILGAPFISSFYTIFNYGELKVGLAHPTRPRTLRSRD